MKEAATNIPRRKPTRPLRGFDKGLLLGIAGLSLVGVWLTAYAFFGMLPIYQRVRDDITGGALGGVELVWVLFLSRIALPALAGGCAGLAMYCIRVCRRG